MRHFYFEKVFRHLTANESKVDIKRITILRFEEEDVFSSDMRQGVCTESAHDRMDDIQIFTRIFRKPSCGCFS